MIKTNNAAKKITAIAKCDSQILKIEGFKLIKILPSQIKGNEHALCSYKLTCNSDLVLQIQLQQKEIKHFIQKLVIKTFHTCI